MPTPPMSVRNVRRGRFSGASWPALALIFPLGICAQSHAQTPATVTVNATSNVGMVPFQGFGIGTAVYDNNLNTAALPGMLADAGITTMRYPGGGYADLYHWSTASKTNGSSGYIANGTDFGHFSRLAAKIGGTAVLTVNYYSNQAGTGLADPFEAAAWVAYANGAVGSTQAVDPANPSGPWKTVGYWAALRSASPLSTDDGKNFLRIGHPLSLADQYWEIGNEVFYTGEPYAPANPSSATNLTPYGAAVNVFAQVMKAIDPTIKIGVDLLDDPVDFTLNWNTPLLKICGPSIDFGIPHFYPPHNSDAQLLAAPLGEIPGTKGVAATLRAEYVSYCGPNGPNVQTLVTESGYTYGTIQSPVVDALFAGDDYATWLENGATNIDYNQLTSVLYNDATPQPSYYGIKMAHLMEAPGDTMLTASSSQGLLHAHAARRANGHLAVMLVNTSPTVAYTASLNIGGVTLSASGTRYDYSLSSSGVTVSPISSSGTYTVSVPAYSLTTLDIPLVAGDVTKQVDVTRQGFFYNRWTRQYSQATTLTNRGTTTISGPVSLVMDGLDSRVTLVNGAGATAAVAPIGSPYLIATQGGIAPGGSITVSVTFSDPSSASMVYNARVLAGVGAR